MGESYAMYKRVPSREAVDRGGQELAVPVYSQLDVMEQESIKPSWKLSLPHVCVATIASFLFGYHIGVVNAPLEYIAFDLGFSGNTLAEGLVVSMFLVGAFFWLLNQWLDCGWARPASCFPSECSANDNWCICQCNVTKFTSYASWEINSWIRSGCGWASYSTVCN